jgi:hypothetical protein
MENLEAVRRWSKWRRLKSRSALASRIKAIFCFNFKQVSESAETVSDFRKNLSNIRKIIKDIGEQPCSLPGSTQVNPICTG